MIGHSSVPEASARRQGIALLMVLGMLVVLSIMALGFIVYVRTERISSKYTVDDASGMDLLQAGIHRSAEYVNGNLSANGWIVPAHRAAASDGARWPGHNDNEYWYDRSYAGLNDGPYGGNHDGVSGRWYITINPHNNQGYITDVPTGPGSTNYQSARFIHRIVAQRNGRSVTNGQFTFEAFDQSGLIDVNQAGRQAYAAGSIVSSVPRYLGLSPTEIDTRVLGGGPSERFLGTRTATPRFFSRMEMDTCGRADLFAGVDSGGDVLQSTAELGIMFSYFPAGWCEWDDGRHDFVARETLYIGGNPPPYGDMQAVLSSAAVGLSDGTLVNNIRDYVDDNRWPQDVDSYCTEATPLINEIIVEARDGGGGSNIYDIVVELWYPFANPPPGGAFRLEVNTDALPPNRSQGGIASPTSADRFSIVRLNGNPGPPMANVTVEARLYDSGNHPVDYVQRAKITAPAIGSRQGVAADDPRLNWDGGDALQWKPVNPSQVTPDAHNVHSCTASNAVNDGSVWMYVRDGAIQVPGELGLLLYDAGRPWQTIDLTNPQHAKILDRFTTRTNAAMRGLVNPNTTYTQVWAAVLNWAPMSRYPDESPSMLATNRGTTAWSIVTCLSTSLVGRVARCGNPADDRDWGWAWRYSGTKEVFWAKLPETSYTNVSDAAVQVGRFFADPDDAYAWTGARPDRSQVEGLIRNTSCLLSTRQNLFGVFISGNVLDGDGKTKGGTLDYFFWLWRDPYLTQHGGEYIHRMFTPIVHPLP